MSTSPDQEQYVIPVVDRRAARRALSVLRKVDALHANPATWCQGTTGRRDDGISVPPTSKAAAQWCIVGALNKFSRFDSATHRAAARWLYQSLIDLYPDVPNLIGVNDGSAYGYDAVRAVERHAIELAEASLANACGEPEQGGAS